MVLLHIIVSVYKNEVFLSFEATLRAFETVLLAYPLPNDNPEVIMQQDNLYCNQS